MITWTWGVHHQWQPTVLTNASIPPRFQKWRQHYQRLPTSSRWQFELLLWLFFCYKAFCPPLHYLPSLYRPALTSTPGRKVSVPPPMSGASATPWAGCEQTQDFCPFYSLLGPSPSLHESTHCVYCGGKEPLQHPSLSILIPCDKKEDNPPLRWSDVTAKALTSKG